MPVSLPLTARSLRVSLRVSAAVSVGSIGVSRSIVMSRVSKSSDSRANALSSEAIERCCAVEARESTARASSFCTAFCERHDAANSEQQIANSVRVRIGRCLFEH